MKTQFSLLPLLCFLHLPLYAQVTVVSPAPVPGGVTVRLAEPAVRVLDAAVVRQQLSSAPRIVVVPTPPTSTVIVTTPVETLKTTKTTTVVDTPGQPRRVYNSERSVVVVEGVNETRELPYVTLPVLFVKETADLLDQESRNALEQVAGVILVVSKTEPGALFDVEGHTSTDGTDEFNVNLSAARAKSIYNELTQRYGVPASVLSAHGYGESFPMYPNGGEDQMQLDRRVLVVRSK